MTTISMRLPQMLRAAVVAGALEQVDTAHVEERMRMDGAVVPATINFFGAAGSGNDPRR